MSITPQLADGIFCRHAEEQLFRWIESQSAAQFTGWLALHFNPPLGFATTASIWDNADKLKQAEVEILEGPVKDELHLFLLADYSTVAVVRNRPRLNLAGLQKHITQVVYKTPTSPNPRLYDLSMALSEFKNLCHQKQSAAQKSRPPAAPVAAPSPPRLDISILQTQDFKALLAGRDNRRKPAILLVEDEKVTAKLLQRLLKDYKPVAVTSAVSAVEAYGKIAPNICFLDIGLPDFSGLEVLNAIHRHDPEAFVIILTGNSSQENLDEALSNGISGFIAKPFTIAKISQYLDKFEKFQKGGHPPPRASVPGLANKRAHLSR